MVALIARRSKYDFLIPDGILTLEIKIQKKHIFSQYQICWIKKKVRRVFWIKKKLLIQNRHFRNFDFSSTFSILDEEFFLIQKNRRTFFSIQQI